jgi:hypothetical protein
MEYLGAFSGGPRTFGSQIWIAAERREKLWMFIKRRDSQETIGYKRLRMS